MARQLAIMKGVTLGCGDIGIPCMWFSTYISENVAALQVLSWEQAKELIKVSGMADAKTLEGKPCWVDVDNMTIKFIEYAKI